MLRLLLAFSSEAVNLNTVLKFTVLIKIWLNFPGWLAILANMKMSYHKGIKKLKNPMEKINCKFTTDRFFLPTPWWIFRFFRHSYMNLSSFFVTSWRNSLSFPSATIWWNLLFFFRLIDKFPVSFSQNWLMSFAVLFHEQLTKFTVLFHEHSQFYFWSFDEIHGFISMTNWWN